MPPSLALSLGLPQPHQALQILVSVTNVFSKWWKVKHSSAERFWMPPSAKRTQSIGPKYPNDILQDPFTGQTEISISETEVVVALSE